MFKFNAPQKVFRIGKMKVGGQPGENPKVMIGTIFYERHKIVEDPVEGIFDEKAAEALINKQDSLCENCGLSSMYDVVGISAEAFPKYLDFVADKSENPILLDAWTLDVRLAGLQHVKEVGLSNRIVHNSIMPPEPAAQEVAAIKDAGIKASILLAFNVEDKSPAGAISVLKGTATTKGLIDVAKDAGIEGMMVDLSFANAIPGIGLSCKAIYGVKDQLGLAAGGAPSNATTVWKPFVKDKWGIDIYKAVEATCQAIPIAFGADWLMYGVIEAAPWVIPAVASVDAMALAVANFEFKMPLPEAPCALSKLFPEYIDRLKGMLPPKVEKP
jgi:tetrahydromethanopterin S-methyltransferase subunit H